MEVVKCGLCKEEIEYSQRCRVYIKTNEPRSIQRTSKRPHVGRYKIISTAKSTEHISFARRLKALRNKRKSEAVEKKNIEQSSSAESSESEKKAQTIKEKQSNSEIKESVSNETVTENRTTKIKKPEVPPLKKKNVGKTMSHPHFQSSFEEYIKPSLSKTPGAKIGKTKSTDSNSDLEVNRKGAVNTYRAMKNGNTRTTLQEFETYYWLDMPKPKISELKKLGYQFENLVTEVKHMKLPSPQWKIKIMVHKQEMVSVSFSNKQIPEKVVSVNAKNSICDISIDNKKLTLIGSPVYIYAIKDLEILLDIMNGVDPDSSLIQYL